MKVDRYAEIHRAYRWDVPARIFDRGGLLRPLGARPHALRAVLGRRVRRDGRLHVLGPRAAGEPPRECAGRDGRCARRQGRADPSAAPGDRRRAHRDQPHRRGRGAAVVPVRARGARIPAARLGDEGRVRRSAVAAEHGGDPRALCRRRARHRRRRRARVVGHAMGGDCSQKQSPHFTPPRDRRHRSRVSSSTRAARRARRKAR